MLDTVFLALVLAAALLAGTNQAGGVEQPSAVKTACTRIASLTKEISGLKMVESEGAVHDDKTGSTHSGCRIEVSGNDVEVRKDGWPQDILRKRMTSDGWHEDIHRMADGAGSTSFALRKDSVLCLFSALWNTTDPSAKRARDYELEVGCFDVEQTH